MKIFLISSVLLLFSSFKVYAQDIRVFAGYKQSIAWMETIDWWGKELRAEQLQVPRTPLVAISPCWRIRRNQEMNRWGLRWVQQMKKLPDQ